MRRMPGGAGGIFFEEGENRQQVVYQASRFTEFVVENGLGQVDEIAKVGKIHDDYRIDYIRKHMQALKEALKDGVEVMGYTY